MTRQPAAPRPRKRLRLWASLSTILAFAAGAAGACGGEPSQFPPTPSLGPAPEAGQTSSGSTGGAPVGNTGGDAAGEGGAHAGEGGAPSAGTSTGGTNGGSGGSGGSGGGDPNPLCGNDQDDPGEECDDGNRQSGDGCSSACRNSCESCEVTAYEMNFDRTGVEEDWRSLCYDDHALAEEGPAAGVERSVLCHDMVECIRTSGCGKDFIRGNDFNFNSLDLTQCFCANARAEGSASGTVPGDCYDPSKLEEGPCLTEMLEASEGDGLLSISSRLTNALFALGRGVNLIRQFDYLWCAEKCMTCTEVAAGTGGGMATFRCLPSP